MQVRQYVIRRLIKLPLVLFAVTVIVFALSRVGGNPIAIYLEHDFSQEQVQALEERYGVDEPLPIQYLAWIGGVLRGDLGWSGVSVAPVSDVLPARFVATMELATFGIALAVLFGIGLGTYAGARRNRFADHLTRVLTVSGASLPLFWFALLMVFLFYLVVPIAPLGRFDEEAYSQIVHFTGFYTLDALLNLNPTALLDALEHLAGLEHEAAGLDLVPGQRSRHRGPLLGAQRVHAHRGLVVVVLAPVDEHLAAADLLRHP